MSSGLTAQVPRNSRLEAQSGHDMLLGQLSPTIKTQLKASKAPFRDISCFPLCQYGGMGELTDLEGTKLQLTTWYEDLLRTDGSVSVHVSQHREHLLQHLLLTYEYISEL